MEDRALTTTSPVCMAEIVDHALQIIASPKHKKSSSPKKTKKSKKLAFSSKKSEAPPLQHHLEQVQGECLDETAPLGLDCQSFCSGSIASPLLAHMQSRQHSINHLQKGAPLSAGPSPGWRLRENLKAEPSLGSLRGTFRRKVLNANDFPGALRIADLNDMSSPGHNQEKTLDSKAKLTKNERVLARHSQDRKEKAKRSDLNGSGRMRRKLERQGEQEAAKQRVRDQAAKQQQQFAPHNRPGVAHHRAAGTDIDEPPSCLVDRIPAEVSFHAKAFLGDDDHQSMSSFTSTLTLSVGSVEQQKQLLQSSRWETMDDNMVGIIYEARRTLSPQSKNAPLAGWQLREYMKASVPGLFNTIPDSKPAVPIRYPADHDEENKCIAPKLPDDGGDFLGFLYTAEVRSDLDCKPAVPIRQATDHDNGTKCVAPRLPDEDQDFLAFLQTKVQDEKKQLDVPPIVPIKRTSFEAAIISKPSVSPPKRWVPPKKASGKGNDLYPAFSTVNALSERLSSSMRLFGAVKATGSSILDYKPTVPIRESTRHEGEKCVAPKLPDEDQDFLGFLQEGVHKDTMDQPSIPTPTRKGLSAQMEAEELNSSMTSFGSLSLVEGVVNQEHHKEQTPATVPVSWSPKKSNGKDLPSFFSTMNESFEKLQSSIRSFYDGKPAVLMRQSSHGSETWVASKLPDEGQKMVKQENKLASRHAELLEERIKGPESSGCSGRSIPVSLPSNNQTQNPKLKCQPKVVVNPSTREYPAKDAATNGSSHSGVFMDELKNRISRHSASDETSVHPSEDIDTFVISPGSVMVSSRLRRMFSWKSTSEQTAKQLEKNVSSHSRGSKEKLNEKASKQATSKTEPSLAHLSTKNSNHSSSYTPGSKVKFQKKGSKRLLKDEPPVDDSANNNDDTHTAGSRIKLKRVSKKALNDVPSLDECANNGSSHTAGSKIKLNWTTKKSFSDEASLDDSANNGSSRRTADSRIKLKRVSKMSSHDEVLAEKSEHGSKGELSRNVFRRSLAKEQPSDEPANKDARGSKSKLKKRVSKTMFD